jgi:UDP-N-acetyl-D-mannosaminuronate dehydrogenase
MKFSPGPGIGGHCIPVDPEYLQYFARRAGNELAMVRIASQINLEMGNKIFERISEKLDGRVPSSVLIAGVSYKSNIPDVRDTPAKAIIQSFRSRGILTSWHDPLVSSWAGEHSVEIKSGNWEVGIIVTAHDILDIKTFQEKCQFVFDCTGRFHSYSRIIQI